MVQIKGTSKWADRELPNKLSTGRRGTKGWPASIQIVSFKENRGIPKKI